MQDKNPILVEVRVQELKRQGLSQAEVARQLGATRSFVRWHWNRPEEGARSMPCVLVLGDLHIPYHDPQAVALVRQIAAELNIVHTVFAGDVLDLPELSSFVKSRKDTDLADDLTRGAALVESFPGPKTYIFGNHEHRMDVYIRAQAAELAGLPGFSLPEVLKGLADLNSVEFVYSGLKESYTTVCDGQVVVGHFNRVSTHSGYTAKNLLQDTTLIQGHTHRLGSHFRRTLKGQLSAWENGCLCLLNPSYTLSPNWQQGFTLVFWDRETGFHDVKQVQIHTVNNSRVATFGGKWFVAPPGE